jgi:membrane protein YdbS with pleckstrin-like domain
MASAVVKPSDTVSFATKVDRWLIVVLLGGLVAMVMGAYTGVTRANSQAEVLFALSMPLMTVLVVSIVAWPTRYELHEQEFVIRSGVIRYRIPYSEIRAVTPSRNPLSAPAWSLDRLRVDREGGYALISPRDKERFLRALAERAKQLTLQGDRLISVDGPSPGHGA